MDYESYNRKGNITEHTKIKLNGPISNSIGFIISVLTTIVGFIIILFFSITLISDYNITKKYIKTSAIVIEKDIAASYTVKYYINNVEYTNNLFDANEHNVGDTITIYYKPDNYNYITYEPNKIDFFYFVPILIGLIMFLSGISGIKKHSHNVMHYIEPDKYDLIDNENTTAIGIGDIPPDNLEFNEKDTSFKRIKF